MDLTKLSVDNLRCVCEFLVEEKLLTEEQLLQVMASRPTNEMKRTTDLIHSVLCNADHDATCNYLIEEQRAECWTMPSHLDWLSQTTRLMKEFNLPSEIELRDVFRKALGLLDTYDKLPTSAQTIFRHLATGSALF